jgi:hypothetical protein
MRQRWLATVTLSRSLHGFDAAVGDMLLSDRNNDLLLCNTVSTKSTIHTQAAVFEESNLLALSVRLREFTHTTQLGATSVVRKNRRNPISCITMHGNALAAKQTRRTVVL